ncbi:MAG TPA: hypothetical protein VGK29_20425 [Paludibaculum sp.]|jgi:hypothetical protein
MQRGLVWTLESSDRRTARCGLIDGRERRNCWAHAQKIFDVTGSLGDYRLF